MTGSNCLQNILTHSWQEGDFRVSITGQEEHRKLTVPQLRF